MSSSGALWGVVVQSWGRRGHCHGVPGLQDPHRLGLGVKAATWASPSCVPPTATWTLPCVLEGQGTSGQPHVCHPEAGKGVAHCLGMPDPATLPHALAVVFLLVALPLLQDHAARVGRREGVGQLCAVPVCGLQWLTVSTATPRAQQHNSEMHPHWRVAAWEVGVCQASVAGSVDRRVRAHDTPLSLTWQRILATPAGAFQGVGQGDDPGDMAGKALACTQLTRV